MLQARVSEATVTVYRHDLLNLLGYALEGTRPPADLHRRISKAVIDSVDAEPQHPLIAAMRGEDLICEICGQPTGDQAFGVDMPSGRVTHEECNNKGRDDHG